MVWALESFLPNQLKYSFVAPAYDGTTVRRYNSTTLRRDGTMVRQNLDHLPTFNQSQDSRPVVIFCCIVASIQPNISGCQQDFAVVQQFNWSRTF